MTKKDKFLAAAQKFLEKGSLDKALAEFQRAAQEDPKDTRTWLRIAEIHVKRGEGSQATQVYLKTADLYVEQGFFQRAVAVYKNVLKLTPGHTEAHFKLADVYKQLGLFSDAASQYDHAATALQRAGRLKEAMNALAQIVEMNPEQVMARVKLAEVASQAGQNEEAMREWGRAAEQLEAQGRVDDYLRVAERLLTLQPDNHSLSKRVAQRYMERTNPKAALAKLQGVFTAMPKDAETLQLLAQAFEHLGQTAKTISVLKELVKVCEEQRLPAERQAAVGRILLLDPHDPIGNQAPSAAQPMPGAPRQTLLDDTPLPQPASQGGAGKKHRRAITFSELAVPPTLAREPSSGFLADMDAPPDLDALNHEQVDTDIQRIITESDIFVKYGLSERAADHLRKVFELDHDHAPARERLAAVLVQLGRKAEAVEELGLLAHSQMSSDPVNAEKHLQRALDLDPNAEGIRQMLGRLQRAATPPMGTEQVEELELNELEMEPLDGDVQAGAPAASLADSDSDGFNLQLLEDDAAMDEFARPTSTQLVPGMGMKMAAVADDDFDFGLDVGTPIPIAQDQPTRPWGEEERPPLDPSVAGDLEQVDFFLEQGLPDEARSLLDDLPAAVATHPEVLQRRARLGGMVGGEGGDLPALADSGRMGAVPGLPKSITPRAVFTGTGGADAATYRDLGIAYKEMGLHDAAIAEFSKLEQDPHHEVFALTMMGEIYEAKGAPAEALLHYKKALNRPEVRDEEATQLYYQLGRVFHTLGDVGEALYFFEKVARRSPNFADVAQRVSSLRAQGVAPLGHAHEDAGRSGAAGAAGAGNRSRR